MTPITLDAEPACPAGDGLDHGPDPSAGPRFRAERRPVDAFSREAWDALAGANPWATPFSGWAFQRAWWDGYGVNAYDETLAIVPADAPGDGTATPVAIVPLMHRHEVESSDASTRTRLRGDTDADLTKVAPDATAIFFGASYHADYATLLSAPKDLPEVSAAVVDHLASAPSEADPGHPTPWDVVDLRRLRCGDPAAETLGAAFGAREMTEGWTLNLEREDVCPVVTFPVGASFDDYLGTLDKKARHEIRRKIRRAEGAGELRLIQSPNPLEELEAFIDLHQKKWGSDGLFPPTAGGAASRVFIRRLFEVCGADGAVRLSFLMVGERRIAAGIHVQTPDTWMYYNAGIDPDARDLSPGVLLTAQLVRRALESGARRFDFLRGDESYKYEWGAVDEPIQRLLVRRDEATA